MMPALSAPKLHLTLWGKFSPQNPMGPTSLIAQPFRGQSCSRLPTVHVELQHWMADNPLTKTNPQN